jgi:hypothetical protein
LHDPGSNTWRGPFEDAAIRQDVTNGHIEPTCLVCSDQPGATPIFACSIPLPEPQLAPAPPTQQDDGVPEWLRAIGVGLAVFGGVWLLGEALNPQRPGRSYSPRLPRFYAPPHDPETVAIRRTAKRHVKDGAEVFADIAGWRRPAKINGHIPDVHALYLDGREVVLEFENGRSVSSTHARRQDAAFSAHADEFGHVEYEQIVVKNGRGGRG